MPELPDVEGFRRLLCRNGLRRSIRDVQVWDPGILLGPTSAGDLRASLRGARIRTPERIGKWLLMRTSGPTVAMHFGMTGSLVACGPGEERHRFDRAAFCSARSQIRFRDMRKLHGMMLIHGERELDDLLHGQGPDAATVNGDEFAAIVRSSHRRVKSLLMDQSSVAGLGNLLVDEILWRAHVHPRRKADSLEPPDIRRIHARMGTVLRNSIRAGRVPAYSGWLTGSREPAGEPCPRCGTPLCHDRIDGRSTVWCQRCQKAP